MHRIKCSTLSILRQAALCTDSCFLGMAPSLKSVKCVFQEFSFLLTKLTTTQEHGSPSSSLSISTATNLTQKSSLSYNHAEQLPKLCSYLICLGSNSVSPAHALPSVPGTMLSIQYLLNKCLGMKNIMVLTLPSDTCEPTFPPQAPPTTLGAETILSSSCMVRAHDTDMVPFQLARVNPLDLGN